MFIDYNIMMFAYSFFFKIIRETYELEKHL